MSDLRSAKATGGVPVTLLTDRPKRKPKSYPGKYEAMCQERDGFSLSESSQSQDFSTVCINEIGWSQDLRYDGIGAVRLSEVG